MKQTARDFRLEVTERIIKMLEEGVAPWQQPWDAPDGIKMPFNVASQKHYRGGNALYLLILALEKGYSDPRWMTYKQAAEREWQVRRGEKGTQIEFWEIKGKSDKDDLLSTEDASKDKGDEKSPAKFIHRIYTVFNACQIDGIPMPEIERRQPFEVVEAGEAILTNSKAKIAHDQIDRSFYRLTTDDIHLPRREVFKDASGYYGTALHELAHWTGHPSRLNRITLNESYVFGDLNYAKEELRAELASLFLATERGLPHDPSQHAAYVASWIKALKEDKNEIFRAAHDASAITDYLLALERCQDAVKAQDSPEAKMTSPTSHIERVKRAKEKAKTLTLDFDLS